MGFYGGLIGFNGILPILPSDKHTKTNIGCGKSPSLSSVNQLFLWAMVSVAM